MGSIDAMSKDDAIRLVWNNILRLDYEDYYFNGCVALYDTEKRERVYYYRR
jgi:hypothetical protein